MSAEMYDFWRFTHGSGRVIGLAGACSALLLGAQPHAAGAQESTSLLVQLRRALGIQRTVVVGGTRGQVQALCVLSPLAAAGAEALTPSGDPPIAAATSLAEVQIWRATTLLWRQKASSTQPLPSPLAWPLAPLQPGEHVVLRLRPYGAGAGEFAQIQLSRPASAAPANGQTQVATAMESLLRGALAGDAAQKAQLIALQQQGCGGG